VLVQVGFRAADQFNGRVVRRAGRRSPGHQPVVHEHERAGLRMAGHGVAHGTAEIQPGQCVGNHGDVLPECCRHGLGAVGAIGQREDGAGMRMHDEFVGKYGVNQGLHRGAASRSAQTMAGEFAGHCFVRQGGQVEQPRQIREIQRNEIAGLRYCKIDPRRLDEESGLLFAEHVGKRALAGSISATVQRQIGIGPEQARGIGKDSEAAFASRALSGGCDV